jgi:hypothetical protein
LGGEGGAFLRLPYVSSTEICILKFIPITCYIRAVSDANELTASHYYSADKIAVAK